MSSSLPGPTNSPESPGLSAPRGARICSAAAARGSQLRIRFKRGSRSFGDNASPELLVIAPLPLFLWLESSSSLRSVKHRLGMSLRRPRRRTGRRDWIHAAELFFLFFFTAQSEKDILLQSMREIKWVMSKCVYKGRGEQQTCFSFQVLLLRNNQQ